jgi:Zn finger protein HypA/HybF involved in hydrogenase expression
MITLLGWGVYASFIGLLYWPIKTIVLEIRQRSLENDFDEFDSNLPFMYEDEDHKVWCKSCKGHGGKWLSTIKYVECPKCDGWGHTYE